MLLRHSRSIKQFNQLATTDEVIDALLPLLTTKQQSLVEGQEEKTIEIFKSIITPPQCNFLKESGYGEALSNAHYETSFIERFVLSVDVEGHHRRAELASKLENGKKLIPTDEE